jgi:uncharacterized protein
VPEDASFRAAWFLRGPHAQTVWGRLARPRRLVAVEREVLTTTDDDDLVVDHLPARSRDPSSPRFVLLHGLEGSSNSVYIQGLLAAIARHGYAATAMNFRSCARDAREVGRWIMNRRPRLYHSGETSDLDFLVRTLKEREPRRPLVAFGASLGGNVLLKWLGESGGSTLVRAAATMSVPYDLGAGARHLERGLGRLYVRGFLSTLKAKAASVISRFPETKSILSADRIARSRSFYEFDDAATGPLHGFAGADDYYSRSSSLRFLGRIKAPTLCISAFDDPFLPREVLTRAREVASPSMTFLTSENGGHVGFVAGDRPWRCRYWAEETIIDWLAERSGR